MSYTTLPFSYILLVHFLGHKNSLVHGFISDDGVFEGKIHVGNDEYFVESAKQYFKDAPQDFHSVIYESRDVHYPHAYGPGCGINDKSKRWMDEVKRYLSVILLKLTYRVDLTCTCCECKCIKAWFKDLNIETFIWYFFMQCNFVYARMPNVWFQKISIPTPRMVIGNSKGEGDRY